MARLTEKEFRISITDLQYFSQCRRQWWLEQSFEPKAPRVHYWTGTLAHAGLEEYYRTNCNGKRAIEHVTKTGDQDLNKLYGELINTPWSYVLDELEEQYALTVAMVTNYVIMDKSDPLLGTPIEVEKYFAIPIGELPNGIPIKISGKIDLIMKRDTGGIWLIDHKTSGQKMSFTGLEVDSQLTGYAWAIWRLYSDIPRGVLYNVLIKDLPTEPTLLKPRKGQTEPPGLSKDKTQKVTYEIYKAAIAEHGFIESDYTDFLQYLKGKGWSQFFQREGSTRNRAELVAFEKESLQKAYDAYSVMADPDQYAYPSASTYNCGYCPLIGVCKAMSDGGDYKSILDNKFKQKY